jgi:hypothetical protein
MPVDFSDARLKLQRGREHIADLKARIDQFHTANDYTLGMEPVEGGNFKIFLKSTQQPDKSINAVIGDAVGNLRSALDYIAVAIVAPIAGTTEGIGFPFADHDKGFAGQVASKSSFLSVPLVTDIFINEIQAYQGGKGHALWVLNKLRNIDKHRFLVTSWQIAGVTVSMFLPPGIVMEDNFIGNTTGQEHILVQTNVPGAKLTSEPKASFYVIFNEPGTIQSIEPVVDFLNRAASQVESILNPLEILLA